VKKEAIEKFIEGKRAVEVEYRVDAGEVYSIYENPKVVWGTLSLTSGDGVSRVALEHITGLREWTPKGGWVRKGEPDA